MSCNLHSLREGTFGGITAAVVGLPTALAFGVASGLGAAAGLPARTLLSLDSLQRVPSDQIVEYLDEARAVARELLEG